MRWLTRCACGLAAMVVLWAAGTPLLDLATAGAFKGCTDRGDCLGDALGRALLAISVAIAAWWTATLVAGWLALRLLRVERAFGTAALGMALTMLLWWPFGELLVWTCVPGFAAAAFTTSRDVHPGVRGAVLGVLAVVALLIAS